MQQDRQTTPRYDTSISMQLLWLCVFAAIFNSSAFFPPLSPEREKKKIKTWRFLVHDKNAVRNQTAHIRECQVNMSNRNLRHVCGFLTENVGKFVGMCALTSVGLHCCSSDTPVIRVDLTTMVFNFDHMVYSVPKKC